MLSKEYLAWGAIILGVVMALSTWLQWPLSFQYLWALLVLIWGVFTLKQ